MRCAGLDCEVWDQIVGVGRVHPTSHIEHSSGNQQKSHADVLLSRHQILSLKKQVSEIAQLRTEFLALKSV